jgi:hypothetical protein
MANQPPHFSRRKRGISPKIKEFLATRQQRFSTQDDTNIVALETHTYDTNEFEHVEIKFIDKTPLPNFNISLIDPFDPLLIQVSGPYFGGIFSYFRNSHMMSSVSASYSMGGHIPTPPNVTGRFIMTTSFQLISGIATSTSMPQTSSVPFWGMLLVTSLPSTSSSTFSIPTINPSICMYI